MLAPSTQQKSGFYQRKDQAQTLIILGVVVWRQFVHWCEPFLQMDVPKLTNVFRYLAGLQFIGIFSFLVHCLATLLLFVMA